MRVYTRRPPSDRFWDKVEKSDGCWIWKGQRTVAGYGSITVGSEHHIGAHRVSYQIHYGPIPENMYVCHHCDNPSCVRPDHLFAGTNSDNILDASSKGRHGSQTHPERLARGAASGANTKRHLMPRGERHGRARLTEADVREILNAIQDGVTHKSLAQRFGVSRPTITAIATRRNWKHLDLDHRNLPEV